MRKTPKKFYWTLIVLFFILLPTWDIIIGKIYFNYLCKTEAGLKIYRSTQANGIITEDSIATGDISLYKKLCFEYIEGTHNSWKGKEIQHLDLNDINKTIKIIKEPQSRYIFIYNEKSKPTNWLPIVKNRALVKDMQTGEVLGEDIGFSYFGAWVGLFADHFVSGVSKPVNECIDNKDKLLKLTLRQKNDNEENNGK
ncbi:MAG: hypothetical protein PHE73_04030 [Sulfurovaceae bacterium]|nr:hypothetical protein [Sulfurovaceae bacterium]